MERRTRIVVTLVVLTALSVMSFNVKAAEIDRSKDYYVMVSTFLSLDYWEEYRRYIDFTEAALPGVKIEMMGPSDFDYEATMAAVDQAIAKGANGLLIQAWDQSLVPSINKAVDAGIPVVLLGNE